MTRGRAARHGLVALVLVVGAVTVATVQADPAPAQTPAATLVLTGQDAWTPASGAVTLRVRAEPPPGFDLALTAHPPVGSRNRFEETVSGGDLGPPLKLTKLPFDGLAVDPTTGARIVTLPLADLGVRLDTRQAGSGVFPLEVDLRDGDRIVSRFVTHLVVADVDPAGALVVGRPLDVAWVWPLAAEPAYLPDGSPDPTVVAELFPDGRLGRQAALLGENPDVPVTLAPSPETLDAWSALSMREVSLAVGLSQVVGSWPRNQVLVGPFVPLDLPSLLFGGVFTGPVRDEFARGVDTLEGFFGPLDSSTALPGPLDAEALAALRDAARRRLVVEGSALTRYDEQFTSAHPFTLLPDPGDESTAMTVLASDVGLERFLSGDEPPTLRAARLLAGLSVVAGEQPNRGRGVTLVNPARWDAPADLVRPLLAGLRANPLLRPVTVDQMLEEVPPATVDDEPDAALVVRGLEPYSPPAPPVTASRYYNALVERDAVGRLFPATDPRVLRGNRALASSLAAAWSTPEGRRDAAALLRGIGASVDGFLSRIHVPDRSTVTFTSNTADLPISFDNDTGQTVRVRLRLESNRLLFPEGAERVIELPPRNHTERIRVETRSPGTFPVTVAVSTEDGLPIQTTRVSVRSSVVSGVGVFLMIGAALFLAAWWGWDIRRRRRARAASPDASPVTPPSGA